MVLIEEELAERGHLDSFLSTLVDLDPNTSSKQAALQHPLCLTSPSSASSCFQPDNAFGNTAQQPTCEVSLLAATTMTTGTSSTLTPYDAVASCDDQSNQANSSTSASHRSDAANSQLLPADFSVLQAAVAAYKQEKKQLWKASACSLICNHLYFRGQSSCMRAARCHLPISHVGMVHVWMASFWLWDAG